MKVHVVVDVEMCRVQLKSTRYPCRNEIIQIGAVMMNETYEIISKFSTYVKPRFGKIDGFISMLTGICERMIKDAPDIKDALTQMLEWIGVNEATFYSWSNTDYFQIRSEIQLKCYENEKWEKLLDHSNWIDYQIKLSERLELPRMLKLTDALNLVEMEVEGQLHDGLDDAYNTARMISKLETQKDYCIILERLRKKEKEYKPLTMSLGNLLQGLVIESA